MKRLTIILLLVLVLRVSLYKSPWHEGQQINIRALVLTEPSRSYISQGFKLSGLYISLPLYPQISYGDTVVISGRVEEKYLKDAELFYHQESSLGFVSFRKRLLDVLLKSLPAPESGLLGGMVLGSKSALPEDYKQALRKTGTSHVVVASGMNVTLLGSFLMNILIKFLPRKKAIWGGIVGICIYILLVGIEAPVVRAGIMAVILLFGQGVGRVYKSIWSLFLASWVMLFVNPSWIRDLGFLLSVVATLSLMLFEAKIRNKIAFIPTIFRESVSTSLAAQIGVTPIIWAAFGNFNPLSPLINALVLWVVPILTVGGIIGAILGLFFPLIGRVVLLAIYPFAFWFSTVIRIFS